WEALSYAYVAGVDYSTKNCGQHLRCRGVFPGKRPGRTPGVGGSLKNLAPGSLQTWQSVSGGAGLPFPYISGRLFRAPSAMISRACSGFMLKSSLDVKPRSLSSCISFAANGSGVGLIVLWLCSSALASPGRVSL